MAKARRGAIRTVPQNSLPSFDPPHIADTSVIINLNASGKAREILRALPARVSIVDTVLRELQMGRVRGLQDAELLQRLIHDQVLDLVSLDGGAETHFERLVIGPTQNTLDDGEAATIAFAIQNTAAVVIDERKATNLCARLFPDIVVKSSLDLFSHTQVQAALGPAGTADAVFRALQDGRIRVPSHHEAWVLEKIGTDRAALCPSLAGRLRTTF
jgi:predicted nucleic acid-binding protein